MALDDLTKAAIGATIEGGLTSTASATTQAVATSLGEMADGVKDQVTPEFLAGIRFAQSFVQSLLDTM